MSENSKIEWTDHTFNPWEGCQKVGPGCDHCYAETRNARFAGGAAINWGPDAPRRRTSVANWRKPHAWNRDGAFYTIHRRRQRVFCASLADWLDNAVPIEWLVDLLDTIRLTGNLDWLMLTKRIGNLIRRLNEAADYAFNMRRDDLHQWIVAWMDGRAPANVWLGATIVNQEEADRDIPKLLAAPAIVRFLSMEPLLGSVDLNRHLWKCCGNLIPGHGGDGWMQPPDPPTCCDDRVPAESLHWVIVGGESGPGARLMHPDWARGLRDQCAAAGVPFLFKQWGEWVPRGPESMGYPVIDGVLRIRMTDRGENGQSLGSGGSNHVWMQRAGKKAAGRLLDGAQHDGFPEVAA